MKSFSPCRLAKFHPTNKFPLCTIGKSRPVPPFLRRGRETERMGEKRENCSSLPFPLFAAREEKREREGNRAPRMEQPTAGRRRKKMSERSLLARSSSFSLLPHSLSDSKGTAVLGKQPYKCCTLHIHRRIPVILRPHPSLVRAGMAKIIRVCPYAPPRTNSDHFFPHARTEKLRSFREGPNSGHAMPISPSPSFKMKESPKRWGIPKSSGSNLS